MKKLLNTTKAAALALAMLTGALPCMAQNRHKGDTSAVNAKAMTAKAPAEDSVRTLEAFADSMGLALDSLKADAKPDSARHKRDWATWKPDSRRALWLALVLPGAGQIYNRKYWKLPIIYGGFVGCAYAMRWNNMMYRDYSQAYLDIMDNDPATQSYNKFLHLGNTITAENEDRWKEVFRKRKDRYRRWRDMSFFVMVGVYALSVVDAYVDASLSEFDISPNLSLQVAPAVINSDMARAGHKVQGLGLQCCLTF